MYAFFYFQKMPFRQPNTCGGVMLATELAKRRPKCPADYEQIARVLSPIFSEDRKPVVLSGRACRERMNGLISKYLEEDKDFTQNSSFPVKRRQRHAKVNFGDDGKRETSNRQQPFAVCRKRDAKSPFFLSGYAYICNWYIPIQRQLLSHWVSAYLQSMLIFRSKDSR